MAQCDPSYPTEFPLGCVQNAISIITRREVAERSKELAVAAYNIIGYGLRTLHGVPTPPIGAAAPCATKREAIGQLLAAIEQQPAEDGVDVDIIWSMLLALLKKILAELLKLG